MKLLRPCLDAQILRLVQVPEIPTDGGSSETTIAGSTYEISLPHIFGDKWRNTLLMLH